MRSASAFSLRTGRRLAGYGVLSLCVVTCATYEDVPPLGPSEAGSPSVPSGGASGGNAGTPASAGTSVAPNAGTGASSNAGTANGGAAGMPAAGATSSGGRAGSGAGGGSGSSSTVGGEGGAGGEGGEPPVVDECPNDPAKTSPGVCGCGFPDSNTAKLASCSGLKSALVHRYDFEGTGTVVTDRVGTAHGTVEGGAKLSVVGGKGVVVLAGGTTGSYVNLPNKLISVLTSATLEAWVTWGGGPAWQRIFDFGDSTNATPEDNPASGKSYLFLTPQTEDDEGGAMRGVYSLAGNAVAEETRVEASAALPETLTHVALVVDAAAGKLILYVNGVKDGEQTFTGKLSSINDVNVWLGRSQFNQDPKMTGTFHDFRVYKSALSALQIATSFAGGADPAFLAK